MKQLLCSEIDGVCDTPIIGRTAGELINNRMRHLKEAAVIYPAHQVVLDNMQFMSQKELDDFDVWLTDKFNQTPDS